MHILLTGGTGFLGGHLVETLTAAGHTLTLLARQSSKTAFAESHGAHILRGSLTDRTFLAQSMKDVDAVVHAAGGGIVKTTRDYYAGNTHTTEALLEALSPSVRDFVLISSLAAHGPCGEDPAHEAEPDLPRSHYGKSKLAAERATRQCNARVTILRPPALYGAGEYRMVPLFRAASRGVVPTVHPQGQLSLLSGRDCAEVVRAALAPDHRGGVFYVAEPHAISRHQMATAIARSAGHSRVLPLPPPLIRSLGMMGEGLSVLRGAPMMMNRDKARDMCEAHQHASPARAAKVLGWIAKDRFVDQAKAIREAYVAKGWL